ncbi:hypothetical protein DL767_004559 [Monosporascus sp. MG133]|nr:hypothetical protein DL767_004559 [Monosporascus sp. MG133]
MTDAVPGAPGRSPAGGDKGKKLEFAGRREADLNLDKIDVMFDKDTAYEMEEELSDYYSVASTKTDDGNFVTDEEKDKYPEAGDMGGKEKDEEEKKTQMDSIVVLGNKADQDDAEREEHGLYEEESKKERVPGAALTKPARFPSRYDTTSSDDDDDDDHNHDHYTVADGLPREIQAETVLGATEDSPDVVVENTQPEEETKGAEIDEAEEVQADTIPKATGESLYTIPGMYPGRRRGPRPRKQRCQPTPCLILQDEATMSSRTQTRRRRRVRISRAYQRPSREQQVSAAQLSEKGLLSWGNNVTFPSSPSPTEHALTQDSLRMQFAVVLPLNEMQHSPVQNTAEPHSTPDAGDREQGLLYAWFIVLTPSPASINPQDPGLGPVILGVAWVLTSFCIIMIAARFYLRPRTPRLSGLDDWFMLAAGALQLAFRGCVTKAYYLGLGKHDSSWTYDEMVMILKWSWISTTPAILVSIIARTSASILLVRIFGSKAWFKWFMIISTVLQTVTASLLVIVVWVQVGPIEGLFPARHWDTRIQLDLAYLTQGKLGTPRSSCFPPACHAIADTQFQPSLVQLR